MKKEHIILEREFNVPAEKIWRALTNNQELKQWYFQLEDFKAKIGFKFSFTGGPDNGPQYLHLCEVTAVEDGKSLTYSWRYDNYPGNSLVTWSLMNKVEKTLVKLTHTGLETFGEIGSDFSKDSFKGGWNYFLNEALKHYLEPGE